MFWSILADRNESEIIVFPDKVQDITVCDCYTLDEFASNIKKPMDGYRNTGISRVTAADLFSEVHSAYCDLPDSCDHDKYPCAACGAYGYVPLPCARAFPLYRQGYAFGAAEKM